VPRNAAIIATAIVERARSRIAIRRGLKTRIPPRGRAP
jgi:hypothetical protein